MSIRPNDPADFTPSMGDFTELKPFRFWCQKVLPLVYDDSLSYYELLCKVVDYLNKTMEDVDTLHTDVENLHQAYVELQEFVNEYFDNLDVQEEINNKLDEMVTSGELVQILSPTIATEVADWLSDHITPTTPAIDNTLTVSGAGADAKVTGDKLKESLHFLYMDESIATSLDNESINVTPNTYCWISGAWFDDIENGITGWLITISNTSGSVTLQYILSPYGEGTIAFRKKIGNTLDDWTYYDYKNFNQFDGTAITNANNCTDFKVYIKKSNIETTNYPFDSGWLITLPFQSGYLCQIAINYSGGYKSRYLLNNVWSAWSNDVFIFDSTAITNANNCTESKVYKKKSNVETANYPFESGWLVTLPFEDNYLGQIAINYTGGTRYRYCLDGVWSEWSKDIDPIIRTFDSTAITNADNCTDFKVYMKKSNVEATNYPYESGWLVTYPFQTGYLAQMAINYTGGVKFRYCLADTWSAWGDASISFDPVAITDANNCVDLKVYIKKSNVSALNYPYENGWLINIPFQSGIIGQFAIDLTGGCKFRNLLSGTWSPWYNLSNTARGHLYAYGDSTTYGQIAGTSNQSSYNWPTITAEQMRMTVHNNAVRGQGLCKDWSDIMSAINNSNISNASLIVCAWAYNDIEAWANLNLGTVNDTTDSTVLGKIYTVMATLQNKAKSAMVCYLTGYGMPINNPASLAQQFSYVCTFADTTKTIGEFYDLIEELCNKNGFVCINQHKGTIVNDINDSTLIGDQVHFTDNGYRVYSRFVSAKLKSIFNMI